MTPNKPTAEEVMKILGLDPAHEKLVAREHGDVTLWERTYDGIRVTAQAVTSNQTGTWHTRFVHAESSPAPVRRASLVPAEAARAKAGMPSSVAELAYYTKYASRQIEGTVGNNAMDYVRFAASFDLVYYVHPPESPYPLVVIDAYDGSIRIKDDGIRY